MKLDRRRQIGIALGLVAGAIGIAWLDAAGREQLHAPGPMNTAHDTLACGACHRPAPGTVRQQLQTVSRTWLGLEAADVDLGYRKVGNDECVACHERPDDRHPTYRFLEPRFADARAQLHPEACVSCHREHQGVRVTVPETMFCRHCHADTTFEDDPLDIPHRQLIEEQRWDSCLGCHDYHGNHAWKPPHRTSDAIGADRIRLYFDGGASPYPPPVLRALPPEVQK